MDTAPGAALGIAPGAAPGSAPGDATDGAVGMVQERIEGEERESLMPTDWEWSEVQWGKMKSSK